MSFFRACLVVFCLATPVLADDPRPSLHVTGEGVVTAAPDMAEITLGVTHEARRADAAMEAVSEDVTRILAALSRLGISPVDLQTNRVSLNPVWDQTNYSSGGGRRIIGFVASNTVRARIRDLGELGSIMNEVIDVGANNFNGLRFGLQSPAPVQSQARQAAVRDAVAKARELAEAAGVTLGPIRTIQDHGTPRAETMEMAAVARSSPVPIAPGELTMRAGVTIVFDIAP